MRPRVIPSVLLVALVVMAPLAAAAEPMSFKLLTNYSQASFRSDAPLETFVGTSALEGIGFTSDNLKVKAKLGTTFTNHGIQVPQLLFLKVANEIQMVTDLVFARQ
jgi:hypothetical protein